MGGNASKPGASMMPNLSKMNPFSAAPATAPAANGANGRNRSANAAPAANNRNRSVNVQPSANSSVNVQPSANPSTGITPVSSRMNGGKRRTRKRSYRRRR